MNELVALEHVSYIEAREMYMLSPAGRSRIDDHIAGADSVTSLRGPYGTFLEMNVEFKQLCTDWQIRDGEPNTHDDENYDRDCIDRLTSLFEGAGPVLNEMSTLVPRIGIYRERLNEALDLVAAGTTQRFTGVMCESFHDIWMELHEDLILLQGIDRTIEGSY